MSRPQKKVQPPATPPPDLSQISLQTAGQQIWPGRAGRTLILGCSGSGKTTLARSLLQSVSDSVALFVVFSGAAADEEFRGVPNCICIPGFSKEALAKIIVGQERLPPDQRPHIVVLMDDLLGDVGSSGENAKILAKAAALCRKLNISLVFLQQTIHSLNKTVRLNVSSVILTRVIPEDLPHVAKFTVGSSQVELTEIMRTRAKLGRAFLFLADQPGEVKEIVF